MHSILYVIFKFPSVPFVCFSFLSCLHEIQQKFALFFSVFEVQLKVYIDKICWSFSLVWERDFTS